MKSSLNFIRIMIIMPKKGYEGKISIKIFCSDGNISYICNVIKSDI